MKHHCVMYPINIKRVIYQANLYLIGVRGKLSTKYQSYKAGYYQRLLLYCEFVTSYCFSDSTISATTRLHGFFYWLSEWLSIMLRLCLAFSRTISTHYSFLGKVLNLATVLYSFQLSTYPEQNNGHHKFLIPKQSTFRHIR